METQTDEQEYGRFPDLERLFGLKRSYAYQLIDAKLIKSVAIRKRGTRSGIRLIDLNSVREFLRANTE